MTSFHEFWMRTRHGLPLSWKWNKPVTWKNMTLPHKKFKAVPSAEKVMPTVFWGIILIEFTYSGTWTNCESYVTTQKQIARVQIQQKMQCPSLTWYRKATHKFTNQNSHQRTGSSCVVPSTKAWTWPHQTSTCFFQHKMQFRGKCLEIMTRLPKRWKHDCNRIHGSFQEANAIQRNGRLSRKVVLLNTVYFPSHTMLKY